MILSNSSFEITLISLAKDWKDVAIAIKVISTIDIDVMES